MPLDTFINFGDAEVDATGYNSSATAVNLATGEGAKWAALTPPYNVTWWNYSDFPNPSDDPNVEIVTVTARTTDALTVTRGQESITATTKNTGGKTYRMLPTLTAKTLSEINLGELASLAVDSGILSWNSTDKALGVAAETSDAGFDVTVYEASAAAGKYDSFKARGTLAAPRRAQSGDTIWTFRGFGAEAVDDSTAAAFPSSASLQLIGKTREAHTASAHGTEMWFATTPTGSTTLGLDAIMNTTGLTMSSNRGVYSNLFSGLTKGKIVFEPTFGADGVLNFYPSTVTRPLAQLEDAVASGGTDRTDTRFTLWGRSGVGAVSDFFSAQMNLGAIDGTSASAAYGLIVDGTWTNGGGYGSAQFLLHDEVNVRNILRHTSTDPLSLQVFDATGGNIKVGGTADRGTTAGSNQLILFNGTAPVGTLTNGASFYAASGEMRVMDSAGNSTLLSPHDHVTNEWIFDSVLTTTGKRLRIDVERLLRAMDAQLGGGYIHESEA